MDKYFQEAEKQVLSCLRIRYHGFQGSACLKMKHPECLHFEFDLYDKDINCLVFRFNVEGIIFQN